MSGLNKSLLAARESAKNVNTTIVQSTKEKRKYFSSSIKAFNQRREAARRKEREDLVEASTVKGAVSRSTTSVASSTRGFLGRIMDFLGTLLVGWAITNLPNIIKMAQSLIKRMQTYFGLLNQFKDGLQNFLISFGSMVGGVASSLGNFDFLTMRDLVKKGLGKMNDAFVQMTNSLNKVIVTLKQDIKKLLGLDNFDLGDGDDDGGGGTDPGGTNNNQGGGNTTLPDPKSAEMYRIAAALSTEGNSDQGYSDMLQVVANRVAHPGYGSSYTEVLAAGTGGKKVAFAGVWKRPGGPNGLRNIQTLSDAAKWAGQSERNILKIISLMTDPSRQASAASFVKGALEFRGSPPNVKGNPDIAADANGFIPGSVWRGTASDNQFLMDPSKGDPMLPGGPAKINLPAAKTQKVSNFTMDDANKQGAYAGGDPNKSPRIGDVISSNTSQKSTLLASNLQQTRQRPGTNTLLYNNEVIKTVYMPSNSYGGGDVIILAGGVNSGRRNRFLNSLA